jgi:serine/threonine-protein kinase
LRGGYSEEMVTRARAAARKAMELDPNLAESYTASGKIKLTFDLDFAGAEADLKKGLALGPGKHDVVMAVGDFNLMLGRPAAALPYYERAMELDPLSVIAAHDMGLVNMILGNHEQCAFYFKKAIDINPNWTWGHVKLGLNYTHMGRCDEALASAASAEALLAGSDTPATRSWLGFTYARCGQKEKAYEALETMRALAGQGYLDPVLIAIVYLGLKDIDTALEYLQQGIDDKSQSRMYYAASPAIYMNELGEDPRFLDMLRELGFP